MRLDVAGRVTLVLGGIALAGGLLPLGKDTQAAPTGRSSARPAWPMFGGSIHRNMANESEKNIPDTWSVRKTKASAAKNVKWSVQLGTMAYGGPVIADGRIFIGTNNDRPRDPHITGDKGVMLCLRESDGAFLWQAVHDKLPDTENNDTPKHGVASTPCVDGSRLYYVSNRCEVVCADVAGDPATHKARILWTYDMVKELGVYPCYLANCSPLVIDDLVFAVTGNGVSPGTRELPAPRAASFVAIHKQTGRLVWKDSSPGEGIMEGQWSNPVAAEVDGKMLVIFPGGDGWLYAFEARTGTLVWKFDCNPKKSTYKPGGPGNRNYLVATPVVWDNKLYVAVGRDPEDGNGVGHLWCIDITRKPQNKDRDLSPVDNNFDPAAEVNKGSGLVWHHGGPITPRPEEGREFVFSRTLSTVAIHDGLLYAAEMSGYLQCLDARTGKKHWDYDLKDETWCSPCYVDGKVYLGTNGGDMFIFRAGKKLEEPTKINMEQALKVPVVAVGGVLYVNNGMNLFAITTP